MNGRKVDKILNLSVLPSEGITGESFGTYLVAVKYAGRDQGNHEHWEFRCYCGEVVTRRKSHVQSGATRSCGCYRREHSARMLTTHGLVALRPAEYMAWCKLKERCLNPKYHGFSDYGGRGIKVCSRWVHGDGYLSGFECFYLDMLDRPSERHSIDRYPDNDGNYESGNCRWATAKEQANNRRARRKKAA